MLDTDLSWKPLGDTPLTDNRIEERIRTVAEKSIEPLVLKRVSNLKDKHIEIIGDEEKKELVKTVRSQRNGRILCSSNLWYRPPR